MKEEDKKKIEKILLVGGTLLPYYLNLALF